MITIPLALAVTSSLAFAGGSACEAPTAPALDHAIIAVHDLDRAAEAFRGHGFRLKQGRFHANGLLNRHVKFRDGTELELMTVRGEPGDAMARRYADLLSAGEGGAYVALRVSNLARVRHVTDSLRLSRHESSSGSWEFLGFPSTSPAAAIFFTAGGLPAVDADSIFAHEPPVSSLAEVWLEGNAELEELLRRLGAVPCDSTSSPDGGVGQRWALGRGHVVVLPRPGSARPRVRGAVLTSPAPDDRVIRPVPSFWVRYRRPTDSR